MAVHARAYAFPESLSVWVQPPRAGRAVEQRIVFELRLGLPPSYEWGAEDGSHMRSPARTGNGRRLSGGESGQSQRASYAQEGL